MRCSDELVERVDLARGDVARERWLRKAVEQALGSSAGYPSNSPAGPTARHPDSQRLLSSLKKSRLESRTIRAVLTTRGLPRS